jgi:hypothetical protein
MKVAVVVEPLYNELAPLVSKMPVWIVESSENKSSATKIWAQKSDASQTDLTTFKVQDTSERQENCLDIIKVIELHHPEMSELLVVGLEATESLRQGFLDIGYLLENSNDVLLARRISN